MADSEQPVSTTTTTTTSTTTTRTTDTNNNNSNNNKNGKKQKGIKRTVRELNDEATNFTKERLEPIVREVNKKGQRATRWWGWTGRR